MLRLILVCACAFALAACSPSGEDLEDGPVPLGDFKLGHNVVVAPKAVMGPLSRRASEEELTTALQTAIGERFDRYSGERLYHFGVSIEGYVLAAPGVPLVVSPKSIMIIRVTVWDDAAGSKMNETPEQITIFESLTGKTAIGSGLTQTAEEQLRILSVNAAKQIELFLLRKQEEEGWFQSESDAEPNAAAQANDEAETVAVAAAE